MMMILLSDGHKRLELPTSNAGAGFIAKKHSLREQHSDAMKEWVEHNKLLFVPWHKLVCLSGGSTRGQTRKVAQFHLHHALQAPRKPRAFCWLLSISRGYLVHHQF